MSTSKMLVSRELFLNVLGLPPDTRVIGAYCEYPYREIEFTVEHADIPEGTRTVIPTIKAHYADCGHVERLEMVSWNPSE